MVFGLFGATADAFPFVFVQGRLRYGSRSSCCGLFLVFRRFQRRRFDTWWNAGYIVEIQGSAAWAVALNYCKIDFNKMDAENAFQSITALELQDFFMRLALGLEKNVVLLTWIVILLLVCFFDVA